MLMKTFKSSPELIGLIKHTTATASQHQVVFKSLLLKFLSSAETDALGIPLVIALFDVLFRICPESCFVDL
jgi:hypothetical protein